MDPDPTTAFPHEDRAGTYAMQAGGYRAFLPKPLPPDPPIVMSESLLARQIA